MARFSRDRVSNKLKRASRRLRRQGYTNQAAQMALASEQARLNEPTTYRPEHRIMEAQAADMFAESQRLAALPEFDYQKDIAPMRGQFFSDLASSGLTPSEQEGFRRRYEPQFGNFDKGQAAFLGVVDAQRKMREQRKAANLGPIVAERLKPFIGPDVSEEERSRGLLDVLTDHPSALNDPSTMNLINTFDRTFAKTGAGKTSTRSLAAKLAEVGDTEGIANLSGLSDEEVKSFQYISDYGKKLRATTLSRTAQTKRLEGIKEHADLATKWIAGNELTAEDLILLGVFGVPKEAKDADDTAKFKRDYVKNILLRVNGVTSIDQLREEDQELLKSSTLEDLATRLNNWVGAQQDLHYMSLAGTSPRKKKSTAGTF